PAAEPGRSTTGTPATRTSRPRIPGPTGPRHQPVWGNSVGTNDRGDLPLPNNKFGVRVSDRPDHPRQPTGPGPPADWHGQRGPHRLTRPRPGPARTPPGGARMRIVHLTASTFFGGPERQSPDLPGARVRDR